MDTSIFVVFKKSVTICDFYDFSDVVFATCLHGLSNVNDPNVSKDTICLMYYIFLVRFPLSIVPLKCESVLELHQVKDPCASKYAADT